MIKLEFISMKCKLNNGKRRKKISHKMNFIIFTINALLIKLLLILERSAWLNIRHFKHLIGTD